MATTEPVARWLSRLAWFAGIYLAGGLLTACAAYGLKALLR